MGFHELIWKGFPPDRTLDEEKALLPKLPNNEKKVQT
jgi:hypothetical protein